MGIRMILPHHVFRGGAEVGQVGQNTPIKQALPPCHPTPPPPEGGGGGVAKGRTGLRAIRGGAKWQA